MPLLITSGLGAYTAIDALMVTTRGYGGFEAMVEDPCGIDPFQIDEVIATAPDRVQVRFKRSPKRVRTDLLDDATFAPNWSISGPGTRTITMASAVSSDPDVIDLYLDAALTLGIWTVTVSPTIISADVTPFALQAPYTVPFEYSLIVQEAVSHGATNADTETDWAKRFNPAYRGKAKWQAVIAGMAAGDAIVRDIATKAFNQVFVSSASDHYLDSRAADRGVARPLRAGLNDETFRALTISVTNSKLVTGAFLEVLEVFYGPDAVRGFVETAEVEPFVMRDGATLEFLADEREPVTYTVTRNDYHTMRRATALEVAAALTRAAEVHGSKAYALPHTDPRTGDVKVRIYSGRRGLESSMRVTGGTTQVSLRFPTELFPTPETPPTLPAWDVTPGAGGRLRFQPSAEDFYQFRTVEAGDYVVVLGQEFDEANRGWYRIVEVYYAYIGAVLDQWFEVVNADGVAQVALTQCDATSLSLFRPTRKTLYDNPSHALVSQSEGEALVSMAATTAAVSRGPRTGAYANTNPELDVATLTRDADGLVTLTTVDPHGLVAGTHFELLDVLPGVPTVPTPVAGTASGALDANSQAFGVSPGSAHTTMARDTTNQRVLHKGLRDLDGDAVFIGGQTQGGGTFTAQKRISALHVVETELDQVRTHAYRWRDTVFTFPAFHPLGPAAAVLTRPLVYNKLLIAGGYETSPWTANADANVSNESYLVTKKKLYEELLTGSQLSSTQGITAALQFYLTAQPSSGDLLTIKDGGTTRTYGFGTGGDTTVTIGGSVAATMANLVTAIQGDGSAAWGAVSAAIAPHPAGSVVIWEDAVLAARSGLRLFGTFAAPTTAWVVEYGNIATTAPDYVGGVATTVAATDPGSGRAGLHRAVASLAGDETHFVEAENKFWRWNAPGPAWVDVSGTVQFWSLVSAGTTPVRAADAALSVLTNVAVLSGGTTSTSVLDAGLNTASTQVAIYDQDAGSWSAGTSLSEPRMQHVTASLPGDEALLIGGRCPAVYDPVASLPVPFSWWDFDESPAAAATFSGPVVVNRNANPRPVGKLGWGVRLVAAMESTGGMAQTLLNGDLLAGNYTVAGWMTSGQGTVLRNGVTGAPAAEADNTLLAFGVDPADDQFFLRWHTGPGSTPTVIKTGVTRAETMPVSHDDTFPRYYHFVVTSEDLGTTHRLVVYINGRQVFVTTIPESTAASGGANGTWRFGEAETYAAFTGSIDQVGFVEAAIDADAVAQLYRGQLGVSYDNPNNLDASPIGRVLATCEVVDAAGWVRTTGTMTTARFGFGTAVLPDGRIVVAGGCGYMPGDRSAESLSQRRTELRSAEVYSPDTGLWQALPQMREAHSWPAMAYIAAENRVYITGGFSSTLVEYLDVTTMAWGVAPTALVETRSHAAGATAGSGTLVLAGGGSPTVPGVEPTTSTDYSLGPASDQVRAGGLRDLHRVTAVIDSTTLQFETPDHAVYTSASNGVISAVAAAPVETAPGPFTFDTTRGFGISATASVVTTRLDAGRRYSSMGLTPGDAMLFPDAPGYLVFNFGYASQVGPVKYLGRLSDDDLSLDASFAFPETIPEGAPVRLLYSRAPFVPENPAAVGSFYLTASPAGRVAAEAFLRAISAAGIELDVDIRYPGDRGLGGEGRPTRYVDKLSEVTTVFGGDDLDTELEARRGS